MVLPDFLVAAMRGPSEGLRARLLRCRITPLVSAGIMVICVLLVAAAEAYVSYKDLRAETEQELATFSLMVSHNLQRSLQESDEMLRRAATAFEDEQRLGYGSAIQPAFLRALTDSSPEITDVFLASAVGTIVQRGRQAGSQPVRDVAAGADFFRVHRDDSNAGLFISDPFMDEVSGEPSFVVSRRLNGADGRFAGIVAARFSVARVERLIAPLWLW